MCRASSAGSLASLTRFSTRTVNIRNKSLPHREHCLVVVVVNFNCSHRSLMLGFRIVAENNSHSRNERREVRPVEDDGCTPVGLTGPFNGGTTGNMSLERRHYRVNLTCSTYSVIIRPKCSSLPAQAFTYFERSLASRHGPVDRRDDVSCRVLREAFPRAI